MKHTCWYLIALLFAGCNSSHVQKQTLGDIEILHRSFKEYDLDSTQILYPYGIFYFNHHLILIERKNNPVLSFWTPDSLTYEFSSGYLGNGPNELLNPRTDYFSVSDSSFFILDSNIEREVTVENRSIKILKNVPIVIPDAINQMVRLDNDYYIMSGLNNGSNGKEHFIYSNGVLEPFGEYPSVRLDGKDQAKLDFKFTAGVEGQDVIFDFYQYHNLIRKYSKQGQLLQEISFSDLPDRHNTRDKIHDRSIMPFWNTAFSSVEAIYVLFYENVTNEYLYDTGVIPELQIWTWEGNLTKRVKFDKIYDKYTVSDRGILYALNTQIPYKIYTYDLNQ